jgi:site-specific recombinase XerD
MKNIRPTNLSTIFRLNNKRVKNGATTIYLRITVDNKRSEIATRYAVISKKWNQRSQTVMGDNEEATEINKELAIIKADILKHYNRMVALDKVITTELLKNEYLGTKEKEKTLKELLDFYHSRFNEKVLIGKKSANTLKCINTSNDKIKAFIKYRFKVSDMNLSEIRLSFITELEHYLVTKDKLSNNSAMKYIHTFKRIIKFAVDQEWLEKSPVSQFRCTYHPPQRERLTMEEIMKLYRKELSIRLAEVRDVFVFCCFTGFGYIDLYKLTPENIVTGIDGGKWIAKDREKTGTNERVPLLPIPLEILDRYKNDPYCREKGCLLPVNTNQCYNAYLKEIATICEVNKYLTTHIARHTFATTVTLENDVPIETVSQMLGHRSIKTTQLYAKVTQKKISNNMKDLNAKLNILLQTSDLEKRKDVI